MIRPADTKPKPKFTFIAAESDEGAEENIKAFAKAAVAVIIAAEKQQAAEDAAKANRKEEPRCES